MAPPSSRGFGAARGWLIAHLVTLGLVLAVLVYAGRGNWFFYDEWDFLAPRAEWSLLAPHNGHLSFFPQLITTLTKLVVGLHSYWPYLAFTFAAHLLVMHLLWRVMMRAGAQPLIALLVALTFGVLAPGADNTLWAFQVGFIMPIATGLGALLIAMRTDLRSRDLVWIAVLLIVGAGFSGTALPMTVAVIAFVWVRHGWRAAAIPAVAFAAVYGAWYLIFNRGSDGSESMRASSLHDLVVRVPDYIAHAFADSVGKMLPLAMLAPAALLLLAVWIVLDLRRGGIRRISVVHYLVLAAIVFATLTALTRINLGNETASSGRYVYVYGALLAPAVAMALTWLVGRGRVALAAVSVLVAIVALFNAGGLAAAGRAQAALEQSVNRAIAAAIAIDDGSAEFGERRPSTIVAPTLTLNDIRGFVERGQYSPVPFSPDDELDVEVNALTSVNPVAGAEPDPIDCAPIGSDGQTTMDTRTDQVYAEVGGNVIVNANTAGAQTHYAQIALLPGMNEIDGLATSPVIRLPGDGAGGLCVVSKR